MKERNRNISYWERAAIWIALATLSLHIEDRFSTVIFLVLFGANVALGIVDRILLHIREKSVQQRDQA